MAEDIGEVLVRHIKTERKRLGISQTGLAKAARARGLPFHQQTIVRIEDGSRPIRLSEAQALVRALGGKLTIEIAGPDCQTCGDEPPPRFTCNTCGAKGADE